MRKAERKLLKMKEKTMADLQSRIAELAVSAARKMTGIPGTDRKIRCCMTVF